jgi:hypothetical protein
MSRIFCRTVRRSCLNSTLGFSADRLATAVQAFQIKTSPLPVDSFVGRRCRDASPPQRVPDRA